MRAQLGLTYHLISAPWLKHKIAVCKYFGHSWPLRKYLLQYMVARHGVHVKYAETLLFSLIPYYEYTIFHRMVNALPTRFGKATAEEEFPRWVENFKHACHPATSVGLVRHVASDSGFFKLFCHVWVQKLLRNHISRYFISFSKF